MPVNLILFNIKQYNTFLSGEQDIGKCFGCAGTVALCTAKCFLRPVCITKCLIKKGLRKCIGCVTGGGDEETETIASGKGMYLLS